MKLEVLLSVMNLKNEDLNNMNITTNCVVINQCNVNDYKKYKNFKIYSYNEVGISNSRNKALEHSNGDILLFCDDDVTYYDNYEKKVINEFKKNKDADVIMFNFDSPNRFQKKNLRCKRLRIYNSLRYGTINIAIRREALEKSGIKFNLLFGTNKQFNSGEDTLFIVDLFKKKLKIYSSTLTIGCVKNESSTWFKGYNEKYFFDKGALFCAISKNLRYILFIQYLFRHKEVLNDMAFICAFKQMCMGAKEYIKVIE